MCCVKYINVRPLDAPGGVFATRFPCTVFVFRGIMRSGRLFQLYFYSVHDYIEYS